ncbi:hypothetical protein CDD81_5328 [Ophiocordyceps australis]|uniref:Uncharacterized protein n=1 Tax=Ophiocordyceps australis TaxID=1399860 RepID=A0A2C5Y8W2_9HYPO|nr:hypothetical protein CDD81_5328 [Ophiocordyceps australis]
MSHSPAAASSSPLLPPLLLTKRLVCFLRANQTAQLPTLLLTTASGKLLAHASGVPVTRLRTQATVAACLLAMHTAPLHGAAPARHDEGHGDEDEDEDEDESLADTELESESDLWQSAPASRGQRDDYDARHKPHAGTEPDAVVKPLTITVQISSSTVIIRRLGCGLLLVAIGPPAPDAQHQHSQHHSHCPSQPSLSKTRRPDARDDPDDSAHQLPDDAVPASQPAADHAAASTDVDAASAPDAASSSAHATTSVDAARKVAASLARWLDDKLCTFRVPDEYGSLRLG